MGKGKNCKYPHTKQSDNYYSYIYNTFMAGWCADAAGARLEFRKRRFTEEEVIDAMHFTGEKTTDINDGQFTDDSEMEIALLTALYENRFEPYFPVEKIAEQYIQWYQSNPFDIGQTVMLALSDAENADDMATNAHEYSEDSESNGSLMRCVPIAVFSLDKEFDTILEIAEIDASLTHYSPVVKLTTGIYCCILSSILSRRIKNKDIDTTFLDTLLGNVAVMCNQQETVFEWYQEAISISTLDDYDAITNEGHVKHAFIMVLYYLRNIANFSYEDAIMSVLKCGGDTDTNAKIVGSLFGAYYGSCIPSYMVNPVYNCNSSHSVNEFYRRPTQYNCEKGCSLIRQTSIHLRVTSSFFH